MWGILLLIERIGALFILCADNEDYITVQTSDDRAITLKTQYSNMDNINIRES